MSTWLRFAVRWEPLEVPAFLTASTKHGGHSADVTCFGVRPASAGSCTRPRLSP